MDLRDLNLRGVRLTGGDLSGSILRVCDLDYADLRRVHMRHTDLSYATLRFADLRDAQIEEALLAGTDLSGADLRRAAIIGCMLNRATLYGVKLKDAVVWGAGIWNVSADERSQEFMVGVDVLPEDYNLRQVRRPGAHWKLDNIELAHFMALIADTEKIGGLLRAASNRLVLLLGRFTGEQGRVLDALRAELPRQGYAPIVFNFQQDEARDLIEVVTTLARLSAFVIADLTDPRSTPLEAYAIVPDLAIPFVPLIRSSEATFSMFSALRKKYFWVLQPVPYRNVRTLIHSLRSDVILPARRMLRRIRALKTNEPM